MRVLVAQLNCGVGMPVCHMILNLVYFPRFNGKEGIPQFFAAEAWLTEQKQFRQQSLDEGLLRYA